jgi:hydroxymethylglutaryl-CoA lyase
MSTEVKIVEVGPRDGLQNEKEIISTEDKFQFISLLSETGLKNIEVTSFVKPPAIPQMGDAEELFKRVKSELGSSKINFPCLVPNLYGYEKAKAAGVKEIAFFTATSDSFTKKNINATVDESFERMEEVALSAKKDGIKMRGYISTAFGCPWESASLISGFTRSPLETQLGWPNLLRSKIFLKILSLSFL